MAFPGDYSKYQEVTIDHTKVSSDLTDFVVYVNLADLAKTGSDIFDTCRTDGGDIRVTKSDGTTQLAREVVSIDTGAGEGELHIKFDGTLSSSSDTIIRIWYNGTDTEPAADSTYGSEAVWSDYKAVYHMESSGSTLTDSTGNGYDVSLENGSASGDQVSGKLGDARNFDGNDSYKQSSVALDGLSEFGASYWLKLANTGSDNRAVATYGRYHGTPKYEWAWFLDLSSGVPSFQIYKETGSGAARTTTTATSTLSTSSFSHVACTWKGGTTRTDIYVDSTNEANDTAAVDAMVDTPTDDMYVGRYENSFGDKYFSGDLDEFRIAAIAFSSDWITTEYNNQNSPSTFYSTSAEQGGSTDADDSRPAELTGAEDTHAERTAAVTGQDTGNDIRTAELIGADGASSIRSAEAVGQDTASDAQPAEAIGVYSWKIERQENGGAWTEIEPEIQIDEVSGEYTYTDTGPFNAGSTYCYRVKNVPDDSEYSNTDCVEYPGAVTSDRPAELHGEATDNDARTAELSGQDLAQNDRESELHGQDQASATKAAETHGKAPQSASRAAEVHGQESHQDSRPAETHGQESTNSSRQAEIEGLGAATDTRAAQISGDGGESDTRAAELHGVDTSSDTRAAETTGSQETTDTRSVELTGAALVSDDRPAEISGQQTAASARAAETSGTATDSAERAAELTGADTSTDTRAAQAHGTADETDERPAELHGRATASSTRSSELTGAVSLSNERGAELDAEESLICIPAYEDDTDPYTNNQSGKYTDLSDPYDRYCL